MKQTSISAKAIVNSSNIGEGTRVEPFTIIKGNVKIGKRCFIGSCCLIREGTEIGDDTLIGHGCVIEGQCIIGNKVRIRGQSNITWGSIIEDKVFIAGMFIGANNDLEELDYERPQLKFKMKPYRIKYGAIISIGVTLKPGVTIGRGAVVGVGSVVTKNVPDYSIVYGNPARRHGIVKKAYRIPANSKHP